MTTKLRPYLVPLVCAGALGCGGGNGATSAPTSHPDAGVFTPPATPDAATPEASTSTDAAMEAEAGLDYGAPSSTYPAFPPNFAQIDNNGGYVMKHPVVVAITWDTDPAQASFDTFVDSVGATAYWNATTSEYGIGAVMSGMTNHVHISTAPPATVQDSDLQNMIITNAGGAGADAGVPDAGGADAGGADAGMAPWPAPTEDTVYAFFLPPGTSLLTQGLTGTTEDACAAGEGGYHDQIMVGSGLAAYAVVPSCNFGGTNPPAAQQSTLSMSHEIIESATDPQPEATPGYLSFDANHFSFNYFQQLQSEVGDACEFFKESFFEDKETTPEPFDAWVQRTWSNASAAAGHDPCVPAAGSVYFNVTPLDAQDVGVTIPQEVAMLLPGLTSPTKGYRASPGNPVTFAVGFYSDGPTNGPWTISVSPGNPILAAGQSLIDMYNPSTVTATVDKTSGQNGEKAYVTVNVTSTGTLFNGEIVTVSSTLNGVTHYMPVWISGM